MGVRNLFYKPLHFEFSLAFFTLWKLLKLYALSRQLSLVGKELAGEKKVVTTMARKDDENYKKTLALLKPYLTSAAYHKTLEYAKDRLKLHFLFELLHLFFSLLFALNNSTLKLWHLAGRLFPHRCVYSHVLAYVALRVGLSKLFRFPFRYGFRFCLEKKHGHKTKSKLVFFKQYFRCYLLAVFLLTALASGLTYLQKLFRHDFHVHALWLLVGLALFVTWGAPCYLRFFYNFVPLGDAELRKEVDLLGKKVGLTSKNVKVVSSEQVTDLLSLSWGFGKFKRLYLNEAYVSLGKPSTLALVAHAVGHYKHHHYLKFLFFHFLNLALFVFAFNHFKGHTALFKSFGTHSVSALVVKLDTFGFVAFPFTTLLYLFKRVFCHFTEFEADRYAVKLVQTDDMVNLLTTVYKEKKWFFNVDPLYGTLFREMPSLFERVYALYDATVVPKAASN